MSGNTHPIFIRQPKGAEVTFVNADGVTAKDLISAGNDGTKITAIAVTSDDTSARVVQLLIHDGATAYLVGSVPVPTLTGTDGVNAAIDILNPSYLPWLDSEGAFTIPAGYKVQVKPTVAITAAKTLTVVAFGGDF